MPGEISSWTPDIRSRIAAALRDAQVALGRDPYQAGDLARTVTGGLDLTPVPWMVDYRDALEKAGHAGERGDTGEALYEGGMGTVGAALTALPGGGAVKKAVQKGAARTKELVKALGYDMEKIGREYPGAGLHVTKINEKGKEYESKVLSPEEKAVQKARGRAQKDIAAGNYEPMFDVSKRTYAPVRDYPLTGNTLIDSLAKKPETIAAHKARFDTPEARAKLTAGYLRAVKDPLAKDWYAIGQLEQEFRSALGDKEGRRAFKEFTDSMGATTGGSDPTANFLAAQYGRYLKANNLPIPAHSYDIPHPVGGRYLMTNMDKFDKTINQGVPLSSATDPKRYNFSGNFQGHREFGTVDEQMMSGGFEKKLTAPPTGSYGVVESVLHDLGKEYNVHPANFQDVAWAGLKNTEGKPMIQHVNESIERTARVTGKSRRDVLVDHLIKAKFPMYGLGGAAILSGLQPEEGEVQ